MGCTAKLADHTFLLAKRVCVSDYQLVGRAIIRSRISPFDTDGLGHRFRAFSRRKLDCRMCVAWSDQMWSTASGAKITGLRPFSNGR